MHNKNGAVLMYYKVGISVLVSQKLFYNKENSANFI